MVRRFTRPVRLTPQRRTSVWIGLNLTTTVIPAGSGVLVGVLNAAALLLRPFTVVRTRLEIMWESDQIATSETPRGAAGLMVVSDTASGLGITAIPIPVTDVSTDWLMWQGLIVKFLDATTVGFHPNAGHHYTVDSKAMRKVGQEEDLVYVLENPSAFGAQVTTAGRILVKLH